MPVREKQPRRAASWRAVKHQAALLLRSLGRDKPHAWPGDRFADRLGINGIVFVPLYIGLYVGRWHQANSVTKRLEFARPVMR